MFVRRSMFPGSAQGLRLVIAVLVPSIETGVAAFVSSAGSVARHLTQTPLQPLSQAVLQSSERGRRKLDGQGRRGAAASERGSERTNRLYNYAARKGRTFFFLTTESALFCGGRKCSSTY